MVDMISVHFATFARRCCLNEQSCPWLCAGGVFTKGEDTRFLIPDLSSSSTSCHAYGGVEHIGCHVVDCDVVASVPP